MKKHRTIAQVEIEFYSKSQTAEWRVSNLKVAIRLESDSTHSDRTLSDNGLCSDGL